MPRVARGLIDRQIYHIINRGNNRQDVFYAKADYRGFMRLLKKSLGLYKVNLFSYCLMPNHFHMVVQSVYNTQLSQWMQWLMTSHVRRFRCKHGGVGHVWQGRFKSFLIQKDRHLLMVLRYVEQNPV